MRVLIVDEHDVVRQALEDRLCSSGRIEVVGCTGCWQEGISLALQHTPDIVLLETKRSDGLGMKALEHFRAECPEAHIVILTSYPEKEEKQQALQKGAARYLLKELDSSRLVEELGVLVQRDSVSASKSL